MLDKPIASIVYFSPLPRLTPVQLVLNIFVVEVNIDTLEFFWGGGILLHGQCFKVIHKNQPHFGVTQGYAVAPSVEIVWLTFDLSCGCHAQWG